MSPDALQEAWLAAWHFAARAHQHQTVPGEPLPYLLHLGAVGMEILCAHQHQPFARPELAVQCALLHDTLEDTETRPEAIEAAFGAEVLQGVRALTKDASLPKERKMADSLERIQRQPAEVWAVKLADRITNLQTPPGHWAPEKIDSYREEARQIHAALGQGHAFLGARLARKIEAYPPKAVRGR